MTMTNEAMTSNSTKTDDEEGFIVGQIQWLRNAVEQNKKQQSALKLESNRLNKELEDAEQALVDYFTANGMTQTHVNKFSITLGYSTSIDVDNLDAVPEDYVRVKTTREPNKVLISEMHKAGKLDGANWFSIKTSPKITIKYEG